MISAKTISPWDHHDRKNLEPDPSESEIMGFLLVATGWSDPIKINYNDSINNRFFYVGIVISDVPSKILLMPP